jgi:hypothetical protein
LCRNHPLPRPLARAVAEPASPLFILRQFDHRSGDLATGLIGTVADHPILRAGMFARDKARRPRARPFQATSLPTPRNLTVPFGWVPNFAEARYLRVDQPNLRKGSQRI